MTMHMRNRFKAARRALASAGIMVAVALTPACDATEQLLESTDPDLVPPADVNSPDGADGVRLGAMRRWVLTTAGPNANGSESTWLFGGLLADEWGTASTFVQNDQVDTRRTGADNSTVTNAFRALHRVRTAVNQALPLMREWRPNDPTVRLAELYLARAFAEMQLASDFCNGIPLSDAAGGDGRIIYGEPISVDSVFKLAVITADSGIALSTGTDTASVNVLYALRVIRARARMATATTAAERAAIAGDVTTTLVPTTFSYNHTFSTTTGDNGIWGQPNSNRRYLVGDSVEGNARNIRVFNAIPFFSAGDPRLPAGLTISGPASNPIRDTAKSQDGLTYSRTTPLYARTTSVAVANGIDARLLEAEAQLNAGNVTGANGMIPILNGLRGAARTLGTVTTPVMANLVDPPSGTAVDRENLLFREAALWTFSRGQRLGNMRRLVRQYGRAATSVYPEGQHYRGTTYGTDLTLPIPQQELNNPNYPGGCSTTTP